MPINRILYKKLIDMAVKGETILYGPVMQLVGLENGNHGANEIGRLLGEICKFEYNHGRPLLTSIVVRASDQRPGDGFYNLAKELGVHKNLTNEEFFKIESQKVFEYWKGNNKASTKIQYWVEQYWPQENRDLSKLYMWFQDKNLSKNEEIKDGDRVLFYETEKHPSGLKYKGSKTIFASGTVWGKGISTSEEERERGGKRWVLKRPVINGFVFPPKQGIPLQKIRRILGYKGWPEKGFEITKNDFIRIESELQRTSERNKEIVSGSEDLEEQEEIVKIIQKNKILSRDKIIQNLKKLKPRDPVRVNFHGKTYKRDNKTIAELKILRNFKCQICDVQILKRDGEFYVEAAHIKPKNEKGLETPDNILILCPNHHKEFDLGLRKIIRHSKDVLIFQLNGSNHSINLAY